MALRSMPRNAKFTNLVPVTALAGITLSRTGVLYAPNLKHEHWFRYKATYHSDKGIEVSLKLRTRLVQRNDTTQEHLGALRLRSEVNTRHH